MKMKTLIAAVAVVLGSLATGAAFADAPRTVSDPRLPVEFQIDGKGFDAKIVALRVRGMGVNECQNGGGKPILAEPDNPALSQGCTYSDGGYVRIDESATQGIAVIVFEPSPLANRAGYSEWISMRTANIQAVGNGSLVLTRKH